MQQKKTFSPEETIQAHLGIWCRVSTMEDFQCYALALVLVVADG